MKSNFGAGLARVTITLAIALCACTSVFAGTATIDATAKYQTISGFGASSQWVESKITSTLATDFWADDQVNGHAGLSIIRIGVDDSGNSNWGTACGSATQALKINPNVRVFGSPWSPPAKWKNNNATAGNNTGNDNGNPGSNTNQLSTSHYGDYATYLTNFVTACKNTYGFNLYALSVQNEPDYDPSYDACLWSASNFDSFIGTYLGPDLAAAGFNNIIMMPESFACNFSLAATTMGDSNAAKYVRCIGMHLYGGGPNPMPASYSTTAGHTVEMWETETSEKTSDGNIDSGIYYANQLHKCIVDNNYNAYCYWWLVNTNSDDEGLCDSSGNPTKRLYTLGNYSKFVKPGFVRIGATEAPTSGLSCSAYTDPNTGKFAIVVINQNSSATSQQFNLTGLSASSVTPWLTDASNNLVAQTAVAVSGNSFTYSIPASCVISFVGTGSAGPSPTNTPMAPTKTNTPIAPTLTFTRTPTATSTRTNTNTPVPPTSTSTSTSSTMPTVTFTQSFTATDTKTSTPVAPTSTSSAIPTATNTQTIPAQPTATNTSVPATSTNTSTLTPVIPTATNTQAIYTATNTAVIPTSTDTAVAPSATPTADATMIVNTATSTNTTIPTNTATQVLPTATNTSVPPTASSTRVPPSVTSTWTNTAVVPSATASRTFTSTATPTLTSTTGPIVVSINLQLKEADNSDNSNSPHPQIRIINTGTQTIDMDNVEARYWFNCDCTNQSIQVYVDWAGRKSGAAITSNVIASIAPTSLGNQSNYVSFKFTGGLTLAPGDYIEIQARFNKSDWSAMVQSNDWSYTNTSGFIDWTKVTGYIGGSLVFGQEPGAVKAALNTVSVLTYPNPVVQSNGATIKYTISSSGITDKSGDTGISDPSSSVDIQLYTVSGRLIWDKKLTGAPNVSTGEHATQWNMAGNTLATGIYTLKVSVISGGATSSGYSRMVVLK